MREALLDLPSSELQRTDLAVIVPAFELRKGPATNSFSEVADSFLYRNAFHPKSGQTNPQHQGGTE